MSAGLHSAVFLWSTPIPSHPWGVNPRPDLHRVVDQAPLRAWLKDKGFDDVVLLRVCHRLRAELPELRQPARGEQLEALAHILREAGMFVEEHKPCHVAALWIDDSFPYGARLPIGDLQ